MQKIRIDQTIQVSSNNSENHAGQPRSYYISSSAIEPYSIICRLTTEKNRELLQISDADKKAREVRLTNGKV